MEYRDPELDDFSKSKGKDFAPSSKIGLFFGDVLAMPLSYWRTQASATLVASGD